jgi:thioredoxin reductase
MTVDRFSQAGKFLQPAEHFDVAVVGAGPAGIQAALASIGPGRKILLVDENPVAPGLIGLDVPLRYGGRATAAVQRQDRMLEQIFSADAGLAQAFDAGVDVRLGTSVWGAWVPGPAKMSVPANMLGLADETASSLVGFDELVVAAGARDLALGFEGADLPGVMGANALHSLLARYNAFAGRRIVVVGDGALADQTAALIQAHGLDLVDRLRLPETPVRATGGPDGVEALTIAAPDGTQRTVACDTIVLAVGLVPNVELPAVLGCDLTFCAPQGGWVPLLDSFGRTSLPFVRVVGDAAGTVADDRMEFMRALLQSGGGGPLLCICEDVSREDFAVLAPPRYLGASPQGQAALDPAEGTHPDHAKRLTRAGMGACQGRRCREQIAMLLALERGVDLGKIPLASYRMPLRPLPLGVLGQQDEDVSTWPVWFNIDTQWIHWRDIAVTEP